MTEMNLREQRHLAFKISKILSEARRFPMAGDAAYASKIVDLLKREGLILPEKK